MWASLILCLSVGLASAEYGWKAGSQYKYQVESTTLTGIHQVADQYSGLYMKAHLTVQPSSQDHLTLQVDNAKYANVHRNLSHGWATQVSEQELDYQQLPLPMKQFQIFLRNGVIDKMIVDKNAPQWQLNFFKSIASQLQVDTQGENLKKSKINQLPQEGDNFGTYKTMEDSVNGKYETMYDISPLPEYVVQSRPELAPLPHLRGDGQFIDIVKTRNFSNSEQHMVYRFGANGHEGWKAGSNQMGDFLSRSSVSRIVLSGNLRSYTIQSSVTEEKVLVAPHLHNGQKGIVYGKVNVTLIQVSQAQETLPNIEEPRTVRNLVYEYTEGNSGSNGDSSEEKDSASVSRESLDSKKSEIQKGMNGNSLRSSRIPRSIASTKIESKTTTKEKMLHSRKSNSDQSSSSEDNSSSSSSMSSSSSSSSQSSSEEYLAEQPELEQAPRIEFAPHFMGVHGSQQNNVEERIQQVANEVGQWIIHPGRVSDDERLSYFTLLSQLVASASSQQLQKATEIIYFSEEKAEQNESQEAAKSYHAWLAYRDAVAQAGTGPALMALRRWINTGKVQGEEAAQLVSSLPNAARYPSTEYMDYFFDMMRSQEVQNQRSLNTSAIVSFADLVRQSQVDEETSRNRYSIHLSGGKSQQHGRVVREKYIPYLQSQLQKAISQGDSIKIQVYIRALGNTAHPQILAVFEPYLEGKKQVSNFQRLAMVASLDEMTSVHPNTARSVLYRIYQNQGDSAEIRVAAVMQLMKTNPPAQMLQRMAEQTNYDHSKQVNAAVKSAIESAASSEDSQHYDNELVANARAAVNLLTPERYGVEYSRNFIRSYIVQEQDQLQYKQDIAYVQGQDSIFPKAIMYTLSSQIGGYKRTPYTAAMMMSSADQLLDMLSLQVSGQRKNRNQHIQEDKSSFSFEKISNLLNLESEQEQQLEGSFLVNLFGGNRFFSYDNHTVEQLPKLISEYHQKLQKGVNVRHTKFYNQYSMELGFPIATGLQFTYSLDVPTLFSVNGKLQGHIEKDQNKKDLSMRAGINGNIQLTYSAQKRGKMGFVAAFNNQRYIAGVDKNILIHLPIQGKVEYNPLENTIEAQVEPLSNSEDRSKLFQFSSSLYTTYQNDNNVKSYVKGEQVKNVHSRTPSTYQQTIGHEASGYALDIIIRGEKNAFNMPKYLRNHDLISAYIFHDMEENIGNSHISVSYNPEKSSPKKVSVGFSYISEGQGDQEKSSKITEKLNKAFVNVRSRRMGSDNIAQPTSSELRREELLRNARSGIQDANSRVFDAYIKFGDEQTKSGYTLTVAHAESPAANAARVLFYLSGNPVRPSEQTKPFEASFQMNIKWPHLPLFNYVEAMKTEPTMGIEGQLNLASGSESAGKVSFKGEMRRSEERKQYLQRHSISAVCQEQMREGNYIQPACRNATLNAYYLDQYDFNIRYQNLPTHVAQVLQKAYGLLRSWQWQRYQDNLQPEQTLKDEINVKVRFERSLRSVNVSIEAPWMSSSFENIKMKQFAIPLAVHNAKYSPASLWSQKLFEAQPIFTAVLDGHRVTTFNNRSYPVELGDCFHVFAMYTPQARAENDDEVQKNQNSQRKFAVLVKEQDNQQKEVRIILGSDEITLTPASGRPTVKANGEGIQMSENKLVLWSNGQNLMQVHSHPDNTVVIQLPWNGLKVIYDTKRVQLSLNNTYRNKVRGLAGSFDGEQSEDFSLPNNRVHRNSEYFVASYALADSTCQGPAKQRQEQAKNSPSYEKRIVFGNVVSDHEAGRVTKRRMSTSSSTNQKEMRKQQSCSVYGLKVVEEKGRTCFSLRPQVTCSKECRSTKNIQKTIDFHCIESSSEARRWVEMIKNGATPDFSQKTSNLRIAVNLPERCTR